MLSENPDSSSFFSLTGPSNKAKVAIVGTSKKVDKRKGTSIKLLRQMTQGSQISYKATRKKSTKKIPQVEQNQRLIYDYYNKPSNRVIVGSSIEDKYNRR